MRACVCLPLVYTAQKGQKGESGLIACMLFILFYLPEVLFYSQDIITWISLLAEEVESVVGAINIFILRL